MSFNDFAIRVTNLSKRYEIYATPRDRLKQFVLPRLQSLAGQPSKQYFREFWALKDISFEIKKGETVGIIGRNGSGKSTLLQIICGTLTPSVGGVETNGRIAALLELGSGFNPEFTGRENVYLNAAVLGLSKEEVDERFDDIAAFADIGEFVEQPVKTYSSGMFVRLAFAVNIMSTPEIMIVDEALAVGDMAFQAKCMTALTRIQDRGATVLFVSHDIEALKSLCSKGIYLECGTVKAIGKAPDVAEQYIKAVHEEMNTALSRAGATTELAPYGGKPAVLATPARVKDGVILKRSEAFDRQVAAFRYGSGGARITCVELLDMDGVPVQSVEFNQEVTINIYFERTTDKDVYVYYGILDAKKNRITGAGLNQVGLSTIAAHSGDRFRISFRTRLPLEEGNYSVMAQLSQPIIEGQAANFIDVVDDAVVFSVSRWKMGRHWAKVYLFPACEITAAYE